MMDRRMFLRAAPMLGLAATAPAIAAPEIKNKGFEPLEYAADRVSMEKIPPITPQERFERAVLELKRAATAIDPSISDWNIGLAANDDLGVRFIAVASRESVQDPSRKAKRRARI